MPGGINGGDERRYDRFFSQFRRESLPLDSAALRPGDGFYALEHDAQGASCHYWIGPSARLELPMKREAQFLRFGVIPRCPVPQANPGLCRINGGPPEYFDNSCPEIHFPLEGVRGPELTLDFKLEQAHRVGNDPRDLSLAIREIQYLF